MPRTPLSRDAILDAALALADESGLEGLSMRAIGSRLGVQAMSLYNHVANKAALLDALHERLILSIELPDASSDWVEGLRATAHAYRRVALDHPQAFVLLATRPLTTPQEVRHGAPVLEWLGAAGFSVRQQLVLMNLFFMAVNGILLAEVAPVPGHSDVPEPDSIAAFRDSGDASASAIADLVEHADDADSAELFEEMVDLVLRGMATLTPDGTDGGGGPS